MKPVSDELLRMYLTDIKAWLEQLDAFDDELRRRLDANEPFAEGSHKAILNRRSQLSANVVESARSLLKVTGVVR